MKRMFLLILVVSLLFSSMVFSADKLIFVSDPWIPWIEGTDGGLATGGIATKILQEIFKRAKIPIEIRIMPFKRANESVQNGTADGQFMLGKTKEREAYAVFTDPFVESSDRFFYPSDMIFEWKNFSDLKNMTIGITLGFNYSDEFKAAIPKYNIKTDAANTDELTLKKVVAKRVDAAILDEVMGNYLIKITPELQGKLKFASKPLKTSYYCIMFSKAAKSKPAKLIPQINKIIKEMKADGTIQKILSGK